ncbi:transposase [Candidatus Pacearchaeota archaeon]|jgi:putative transposase|nr:transposase [Candidatus Pacearchaeota archaeon]
MLKAFKYRIYPNSSQQEELARAFGSCRFLYNKALEYKKLIYESEKKSVSYNDLATVFFKDLKEEFDWLKETPSQALQQSLKHLDSAYQNFFKKQSKFPSFKRKFSRQSFSIPQFVKVNFKDSIIRLPKIGNIKTVFHRTFEGIIKTCTVSKTPTNKYYISILVDDNKELPNKVTGDKAIGIDLGIKSFATFSNGEKVDNPKFYDRSLNKLKALQTSLSRKIKGSANYRKLKLKLAILHEKICNRRDNFLHQLSKKIINDNQVIITEDLAVQTLMEKSYSSMSRNIGDVSWSKFVTMLKYKAEWNGKRLVQIGRYDPSSKKCSGCGNIYYDLKLEERTWICDKCGKEHDRDVNAAVNILQFGMEQAELKCLDARRAERKPTGSSCG